MGTARDDVEVLVLLMAKAASLAFDTVRQASNTSQSPRRDRCSAVK